MTSMTVALLRGTLRSDWGPARAIVSNTSATASTAKGTWRNRSVRLGVTDLRISRLANFIAREVRRRWM